MRPFHFPADLAPFIRVQSSMKLGLHLIRPVIVVLIAACGWRGAMFWPRPIPNPPGSPNFAPAVSYGYPWEFGVDYPDVASGFPCSIDVWTPW